MQNKVYQLERLKRYIRELSDLRYKHRMTISEFTAYPDNGEIGQPPPDKKSAQGRMMRLGDRWSGKDKYLWLSAEIVLPALYQGRIAGLFDLGESAGGNMSKFEALLYLNGEPWQGLDLNHQEFIFDPAQIGSHIIFDIRLWSGLSGGGKTTALEHQLRRAEIALLDENADRFHYLAKNTLETIHVLEENNPHKTSLIASLLKAFERVDYSQAGSAAFYESMGVAYEYLLDAVKGKSTDISVNLVGHTHIDLAWLWRFCHSREKAARSFSTVNRLMEQYPEYLFLQSQAQIYEYLKQDYPQIYQNVKKRIAQKKWEPAGGMWVECDCNLVSGESLVRQIMFGKAFFEQEFQQNNDFLWLPDVFGYSWALPQILKKSGINTFCTIKISWNDTNRIPADTFFWKGIDGSEVLAHFISAPEHGDRYYYTYNGMADPFTVDGVWKNYQNKDINTELLVAYGYGDGGGGVNRDMLENIRCMKKIKGLPEIKNTFAGDYFRKLNNTFVQNTTFENRPMWNGELYLEFHRGTYTSQAYNKKMNRKLEFLIRNAEILSVQAMVHANKAYPQAKLVQAWKIILRNQFHDILPGSSIREVYEDCKVEYEQAEHILNDVIADALESLVEPDASTQTIINTLPFTRRIFVKQNEKSAITAAVPAFSAAEGQSHAVYEVPLSCSDSFENDFYQVCWNQFGQFVSLFDKGAGREVLPQGQVGNRLVVYEDKPRDYDAWEIEMDHTAKYDEITELNTCQAIETAFYKCLLFTWNYKNSRIEQKIFFYNHTKRIDFSTKVWWQEREKLLRTYFPIDITPNEARFDIQFGNVRRATTRNNSWEAAQFEAIAHKWADLSENGYGVAILNDCKYGHRMKDNVIGLTLLKSSNFPDYAQDLGEHEFLYALYPHKGHWSESNLMEEAYEINTAPIIAAGKIKDKRPLFQFDADNVMLEAAKKAESDNAIVLRLVEHKGKRASFNLTPGFDYSSWSFCDLMENNIASFTRDEKLSIQIKPYEICTIKLYI